jgi:hypothetical protein
MNLYSLLADVILVIHFAFVAFVVAGLALIWLGWIFRWPFVRNRRFRFLHLFAMGFVLAESLAGFICPLTTWENELRVRAGGSQAYEKSFVEFWFGRLLFHDWSETTFTFLYTVFFILLVSSFWLVPPRRLPQRQRD